MNNYYWQGFNDGKRHAVNYFVERFDEVKKQPGIGEKTLQKIIEAMDLPMEDEK